MVNKYVDRAKTTMDRRAVCLISVEEAASKETKFPSQPEAMQIFRSTEKQQPKANKMVTMVQESVLYASVPVKMDSGSKLIITCL